MFPHCMMQTEIYLFFALNYCFHMAFYSSVKTEWFIFGLQKIILLLNRYMTRSVEPDLTLFSPWSRLNSVILCVPIRRSDPAELPLLIGRILALEEVALWEHVQEQRRCPPPIQDTWGGVGQEQHGVI